MAFPRGRIRVIGPGQYAWASFLAFSGSSPSISAGISSMQDTWTISGLSPGRPLASKMRRTASPHSALAPRPYTVSVGNPTSPPSRIRRPASCRAASSGAFTCVVMSSHPLLPFTWFCVRPSIQALMLRRTVSSSRARASFVAQAMCGVTIRFFAPTSG